jgi:flagellar motility protein MotE (MotC chaperone)
MEEKISELRQLKQQRAELDERIKALAEEVKASMKAFLKQRK